MEGGNMHGQYCYCCRCHHRIASQIVTKGAAPSPLCRCLWRLLNAIETCAISIVNSTKLASISTNDSFNAIWTSAETGRRTLPTNEVVIGTDFRFWFPRSHSNEADACVEWIGTIWFECLFTVITIDRASQLPHMDVFVVAAEKTTWWQLQTIVSMESRDSMFLNGRRSWNQVNSDSTAAANLIIICDEMLEFVTG